MELSDVRLRWTQFDAIDGLCMKVRGKKELLELYRYPWPDDAGGTLYRSSKVFCRRWLV